MTENKNSIMPAFSQGLNSIEMHPITLSFQSDLEKTFRKHYYFKSLRTVRLALLAGIVFFAMFAILDAILVPAMKWPLWTIRFAFVCPGLALIITLSYFSFYRRFFQFCLVMSLIISGGGIIYMIAILPAPVNQTYYAGLILVLIWGYTFLRSRFIWASTAGWIIVVVYEIVAFKVLYTPLPVIINNSFFFIASNLVGMCACYFIELYTRRDFYLAFVLEKEQEKVTLVNRRLEKIVAKRTAQLLDKNKELSEEIDERRRAEKERADLESKFQESQKMEALGTLAGGIAHDFNNLLMAIQGNTSLMKLKIKSGHILYDKLKNIEQFVVRGSELTRQLLGFARRGKYQVNATNMNVLINECTELFGRTNKEVEIHLELMDNPWVVNIDRGQIEQVLLNLFVNAWQAMPTGGNINIKTQNVLVDADRVKGMEAKPGNYIVTSVTDQGIGMDETVMQRIFDPFFTTKEMSRGTGMGLASAYGIVQNHGGFFEVESKIGKGSRLSFYLPATEGSAIKKPVNKPGRKVHGRETILLVDDEVMVAEVAAEMLEALGYTVYIATSGDTAIELYEDKGTDVDLVILDLIMPGMSGSKTFEALKERNPYIKVLLSSGYSLSGEAASMMERGCSGFIQKPYNMTKLSQKVREVLEIAQHEHNVELSLVHVGQ